MWIRGGGRNAYPQNVDKHTCFFITHPKQAMFVKYLQNVIKFLLKTVWFGIFFLLKASCAFICRFIRQFTRYCQVKCISAQIVIM